MESSLQVQLRLSNADLALASRSGRQNGLAMVVVVVRRDSRFLVLMFHVFGSAEPVASVFPCESVYSTHELALVSWPYELAHSRERAKGIAEPVVAVLHQAEEFRHMLKRTARCSFVGDLSPGAKPPQVLEDYCRPHRRSRQTGVRQLASLFFWLEPPAARPSSRLSPAPAGAVQACSSVSRAIRTLRDVWAGRPSTAPAGC